MPRRLAANLPAIAVWIIVLACCGLPLGWLVVQVVAHPHVLGDAVPDRFRWWLIARTFGFNALAAGLATVIAVPVGIAIACGRTVWARSLGLLVAVPLLLPSLVMTYGWKQVYARLGYDPMPQSAADVARCIVALASWVWPVPAMALAFFLRRVDADLLLQARLEGASGRIISRLMAGPLVIGFLGAMLLSLQEFAIFEPSGISVIATEVRAVFETGSSLDQSWTMLTNDPAAPSQEARMGAAIAVMLPSLLGTLLAATLLWRAGRQLSDGMDWHAAESPRLWPGWTAMALGVVGVAIALPIIAMARSLRSAFEPGRIINEYWPQLVGSTTLALLTAAVGVALIGFSSAIRMSSGAIRLAIASFLVGGQWTAIALIVIFGRHGLYWIYDSAAMPAITYVSRFAWIALAAASLTWSPGARWLRDLAATDGAGRWATWRYVMLPLAWPLFTGAAVLIFTLALTEVPATTLLQPAQTLVPMLMTWAHILNYDAMIEASLLMVCVVMIAGVSVTLLVRTAGKWAK